MINTIISIINAIKEPDVKSEEVNDRYMEFPNSMIFPSDIVSEITYDDIVGINTIIAADIIPGSACGIIFFVKVWNGLHPKS